MKAFEEYNREIRKNIIDQWAKSGHNIAGLENDPVINLLLSALAYQAYHIHRDIDQYEEKLFKNMRDRTLPYQLTKPVPAFSVLEAAVKPGSGEKILDENCSFDFVNSKKQKVVFSPILSTKVMCATLSMAEQLQENVWKVILESKEPIESLSGLSFYLDTLEPVEIESVKFRNKELPLIKPSQYSELPFTGWFNNAHLFINQNYYLFGTYDFWKELFLTNTTKLFYIGQYGKEISTKGETNIELEVAFNKAVSNNTLLKINCVPVVNVEKKEVALDERNPVRDLSSETEEFLNFLFEKNGKNDFDNVILRQHNVERYNSEQLFEQIQDMLYRFNTDYYAFQNIKELSATDKLQSLKEIMDDFRGIVSKADEKMINDHYYAILKKNSNDVKRVDLKYLVTSGAAGNGIKEYTKPTKSPVIIDNAKTSLLVEAKGGRNSIKDEAVKEEIAKYYFQTKDRWVTPADITLFIKTFYHNDDILGKEIENISIDRQATSIQISIILKSDSYLRESGDIQSLEKTLQNKITLRSSGILPFIVKIS
jgi:hypothetical protein